MKYTIARTGIAVIVTVTLMASMAVAARGCGLIDSGLSRKYLGPGNGELERRRQYWNAFWNLYDQFQLHGHHHLWRV